MPEEYHNYLIGIDEVLRRAWDIAISGNAVEKTRLEALQFGIECSKHKMNVILNGPLQSNNTIKPFKRNSRVDAIENNSYNSSRKNQKEIEKNQF